jgi:hypothetical protein
MKAKRTTILLAAFAILGLFFASTVMADLVVVATDASFKDAQKWVDFLTSKEVAVQHVTPQNFSSVKQEQYMVIMGSLDESGGVKDIVKEALSDMEFADVGKAGNKEMYIKSDVWGEDQGVIVFSGATREDAIAARVDNKADWWDEIALWFDIETGGVTLHGY